LLYIKDESEEVKTIIAYLLVVPISFLVSRLAAAVASVTIFSLLRRVYAKKMMFWVLICSYIKGIVNFVAAVTIGWCVFNWIVGARSFTIFPFILSLFIPVLRIPKHWHVPQEDTQIKTPWLAASKAVLLAQNLQPIVGVGEIFGLILTVVWFFLK
jgi:hypothetical protein